MQVIQVSGKPVVLTAPVRLVLEIDISQVTSDSAIPSGRKFLPFKGIVQLLLDFVFLFFEELLKSLCIVSRDVQLRPDV